MIEMIHLRMPGGEPFMLPRSTVVRVAVTASEWSLYKVGDKAFVAMELSPSPSPARLAPRAGEARPTRFGLYGKTGTAPL